MILKYPSDADVSKKFIHFTYMILHKFYLHIDSAVAYLNIGLIQCYSEVLVLKSFLIQSFFNKTFEIARAGTDFRLPHRLCVCGLRMLKSCK